MCYQQSTLAENFIVYHGLPVHSIPSYDHTETGIMVFLNEIFDSISSLLEILNNFLWSKR